MSYLDRASRVVDFVLTETGRRLYAIGQLDFVYYSFFDDGLDYNPYSTGTLSDAEREIQIEALPMLEAPFVRDVRAATAPLEPLNHLFSAAPGYSLVPFMSSPADGSQITSSCYQRPVEGGYARTGINVAQIDLSLKGDAERGNAGFIVRIFASGSNGIMELAPRNDLAGRRSYDSFLAVKIDDEVAIDSQQSTSITMRKG